MMGLAIVVIVILGSQVYHFVKKRTTEPTTAAPCFEPSDATYSPGTDPLPDYGSAKAEARRDQHYLRTLQDASRVYTPTSCDKDAVSKYDSALFWYLSDRMHLMRRYDFTTASPASSVRGRCTAPPRTRRSNRGCASATARNSSASTIAASSAKQGAF
jgi:hypothetical protein